MSDESDYNMEMRLPLILVSASILFTTANAFGQYTPPEAVQQVKPPLLLGAAAEAACRAKFTPTTFGGEPVKVGVQINFNFEPSP